MTTLAPERKGKALIRHEDLADFMIANPAASRKEIATFCGYSEHYVSVIICSDAFEAIFARRKGETVNPVIRERLEAGMRAIVERSQEVLLEKLSLPAVAVSDSVVLKALELGAKGAVVGGFAPAKPEAPVTQPAGDRIDALVQRLDKVMGRNTGPVVDVESREV